MTIKLILLKSGEDILSDIQEMVLEDKVIGYFLTNPCVVKLKNIQKNGESNQTKTSADISLYPWIPLSDDKKIPIPSDWVITMVNPIEKVIEMYKKTFNMENNDD
jgi:hypothetical protein